MNENPEDNVMMKFTPNKEWTEEEIKQNCKTIATGYIMGPDLEFLEKEWEKLLDEKIKEIKDHFKIKENKENE